MDYFYLSLKHPPKGKTSKLKNYCDTILKIVRPMWLLTYACSKHPRLLFTIPTFIVAMLK